MFSRYSSSVGPSSNGVLLERAATLSPRSALIGITSRSSNTEAPGELAYLLFDLREPPGVPVDQVHLVHAHDHVPNTEQCRDVRVSARLGEHAAAGVDQYDRDVGVRGSGEHVARVALVSGRVGQNERAPLGRKEPIGDVDRDPLFALGAQAIGNRRKVRRVAIAGDVVEVIAEQRSRVPAASRGPDEGALAVVDRAGGGEPQQQLALSPAGGAHQK